MLDLPALVELLRDLHSRKITLVEVETQTASPFASSLLFDYVATYMYEGDTPNAERRAAALALDRDLLRELLGQEELRELIDPEALDEVEASAPAPHRAAPRPRPRRPPADAAPPRRPDPRGVRGARRRGLLGRTRCSSKLERERRAGGPHRRRGALDRRRGCRPLPRRARRARRRAGCPRPSWSRSPDAMAPSCAATRAPTARSRPRSSPRRYGIDPTPGAARARARRASWSAASCCPAAREREWCDADVLRRLRRASLAHLRQEVEAADRASWPASCPSWQNVDAHRPAGAGPDRLREALVPLQGVALTPEVWERDVLPRRLGAYSPAWLDELSTERRAGLDRRRRRWAEADGRVALYFREDVRLAGPPPVEREARAARRARSTTRSASGSPAGPRFWLDLVADLEPPAEELHSALWDLAWAGEVDQRRVRAAARPAALRAVAAAERRGRRFASPPRRRRAGGRRAAGR